MYELVSHFHTTCEGMVESESSSSDSAKIDTPAVKLFHDSLEPVRLDVHHNMMVEKQEEENASKQGQYGSKRKRKKPPR